MKIAVLVKHVPDTYGERQLDPATRRADRAAGDQVIDEISERAVEVALAHKDQEKSTEVVAVTMGPAQATDALRKSLAMGADRAIHVVDDALAGADLMVTATVLAAALRPEGFDLVIAGNESTDGRGGVLPALLAELLGLPLLSALRTVRLTDTEVSGARVTDAARPRSAPSSRRSSRSPSSCRTPGSPACEGSWRPSASRWRRSARPTWASSPRARAPWSPRPPPSRAAPAAPGSRTTARPPSSSPTSSPTGT